MTRRPVIAFVRTWLPVIVCLGGVLLIAIRQDEYALEGGAGIIGAGLSIWLFNILMRVGNQGEKDREDEEAARAHFDRTGRWPDEATPAPAADPVDTPPTTPPARAADPHRREPLRPRPRR